MHQAHWALQDVDVEVKAGETFGLIGENGAGKSTFLKLVAGTSNPTKGDIKVNGRVAALLELGAGFHPEESGRENVYLMGALNGIRPKQMIKYYTEIADFAELSEDVLERPVKTYSSGMFMRLAFATATAVDPDILIIDEALSVGDMYFQKKSLDRIMSFRDHNKTVLFCSHNMYQIRSLCQRAAWLHEGRIRAMGETEAVATAFESFEREKQARLISGELPWLYKPAAAISSPVRIVSVRLEDIQQEEPVYLKSFQNVTITTEVESLDRGISFNVGIAIVRNDKENIFGSSTHFGSETNMLSGKGHHRIQLILPDLPLLSGEYWLSVYVLDDSGLQVYDMAELICPFTIHNPGQTFGIVHLPHQWNF
jgi:lipopolysaccharide transport system ATP-binding protein